MIDLYRASVQPWMCDMMGHFTTREYMSAFDEASYQLLSDSTGWSMSQDIWHGTGWVDVRHLIEYVGELHVGALVNVRGCVKSIGRTSLETYFELSDKDTGKQAATLLGKTVFFDLEQRCSKPITDAMRERIHGTAFQPNAGE